MHLPSRKTLLNWMTLGVSAFMALLLLEGLSRWFIPDPDLAFENRLGLYEEDQYAGFRNRPNYRAWAHGVIEVRINALGFRGPELALQKSPGTKRVLGVGDSVAFGTAVQERDIYLRRLERDTNAASASDRRVEVVNLGVIGYSLHQEVISLRTHGLSLKPDIVLVSFVMNDPYPTEDPFFNVHKLHLPPKTNVQRRLYQEPRRAPSYAYRLALTLYRRWQRPKGGPYPLKKWWPEGGYEMQAWPYMQEDFRELKRLAAANSFHLGVVLFPVRDQFEAGERAPAHPQRMIEEFLRAEGIPFLDLYDPIGADPKFLIDQMHLSVSGHAVAAREIGRFIQQQGW